MGSYAISLWRRAECRGFLSRRFHTFHLVTKFALLVLFWFCVGVCCFPVWLHLGTQVSCNYCIASLTSKRSSDRQCHELDRLQRKKRDGRQCLELVRQWRQKKIIWDHKKSPPQKQVGNFLFVFILCVVFNSIETSSFNASTSWPFLAAHLEAPLFCNSPFALTQLIHRLLSVTSAPLPSQRLLG